MSGKHLFCLVNNFIVTIQLKQKAALYAPLWETNPSPVRDLP
ncbi:hypothetical protein HMPREF0083_00131 [Aneurinibacillus aneurinilyticus ATCC 12856]|uniref:Uncharacterized protein n=1 Tax=Aneurinibacillus aneurinilyticus ATCC 12856 TaxID=649747 RepID=U1XB63_ANEAE|nr:hypothetical protein HMPREF0083_00131 [Aneurinibacillus aneurinilyticus ATCC 12856]